MKPKSKRIAGLLASLFCVACILFQPLAYVFAAGTGTNGWEAAKSPNTTDDRTAQVKLESLGEEITAISTSHLRFGAAVKRWGLTPIRKGKFSIDFELKSENISLWHSIWIPILWDCYQDAGNPDAARTNNGLTIKLLKGDATYPTGWKVSLFNRENKAQPGEGEFTTGGWQDIDLTQKLHIVIETIDSLTKVYINGKLYGETQFTADVSGYLWNGSKPTIALGGGPNWDDDAASGEIHAVIDTHAPDSTEALQELIGQCNAAKNPNASAAQETAFRAAVTTAETGLNGAEPAVLAAIEELTEAKQVYDNCAKAPERVELENRIADCKRLAEKTAASDTPGPGQATTAAKEAFVKAIADAEARLNGTTEELKAAAAALEAAKKAFTDPLTNGWEAAKDVNAGEDKTGEVRLESRGDGITEIYTPHFKYGGAVKRNGLTPIRDGKFSIDFELKEENIVGAIWMSILYNCYQAEGGNFNALDINNGLQFTFTKTDASATGWKISLLNKETDSEFTTNGWQDIDLSKKLHMVIETAGGVTRVYIDSKLYGETQFTADVSGYLWNGSKPTIALGGGANWDDNHPGEIHAVIDTHAPDSTETLQALIGQCNAAKNPDASASDEKAFRDAVRTAEIALQGAEPAVLAAIEELKLAKMGYDACGEAPERVELMKEITVCEKLAGDTAASDTPGLGQTTPAAKNTFTAAIAAAKAKTDGTIKELTEALAALKAAKKAFSDSILRDTGWKASWLGHADQAEDKTDEVQIRYLADDVTELVVGDHWTSGAELQHKFKPSKIGKWEFDFKVLPDGTTSNWFNIAWAYDVYNVNELTTPGNTTNGLYFKLDQLATSPKLSIYGVDIRQECSANQQWEDLAVGETYHVVWETVRIDSDKPLNNEEEWEPFKFETTIYVNDRVYGTFNTPNQSYYWRDDCPMTFGVGGDGQTKLIMDISPETNEEKLRALIASCKARLLAQYTDGKSAAASLQKAIEEAEAALDGTEDVLIKALAALKTSETAFVDATARVNTQSLRQAIARAEAAMNVLDEETKAYGELAGLIQEAKALIEADTAEQAAFDAKAAALEEAVERAKMDNIVFDVTKLDKFDPTGLTLKGNGKLIRFATTNKPGKLYSENWFDVSTTLAPARKLVFNIKDLGRIDGQYSRVNFTDSNGELAFYVEILESEGDGILRVCLPPEIETDPTSFVPLVVTNYVQGEDAQVALEATEDDGIRISIDGKILYEEANSIASLFNGKDGICVHLSTGGDKLGDQHMTLDFAAKEIPVTPVDPGVDPSTPDSSDPDSSQDIIEELEPPKTGNPPTGYLINSFLIVLALTSGIMVVLLIKRHSTQKA